MNFFSRRKSVLNRFYSVKKFATLYNFFRFDNLQINRFSSNDSYFWFRAWAVCVRWYSRRWAIFPPCWGFLCRAGRRSRPSKTDHRQRYSCRSSAFCEPLRGLCDLSRGSRGSCRTARIQNIISGPIDLLSATVQLARHCVRARRSGRMLTRKR